MKKAIALVLGSSMLLSVASCSLKKVEVPSKSDVKDAAEEEYGYDFKVDSEDISKDEKEAEWVLISKDGTFQVTVSWSAKDPEEFEFDDEEYLDIDVTYDTEPTESSETETTESSETEASESETTTAASSAAAVAGSWIDFDDMHFFLDGKKYTLGTTTLQDMIDAGVPFESDSLENSGNNVSSNAQMTFDVQFEDKTFCKIYVLNDTDSGIPANECIISEIYFPVEVDQTHVSFDFPLTITAADLKASCGEPNEDIFTWESDDGKHNSEKWEYTRESTVYYGNSYYKFDFYDGELDTFYLAWLP